MAKRDFYVGVLLGFLLAGLLLFSKIPSRPFIMIAPTEPTVMVRAAGLELHPTKGQAMMLLQPPPLIDPAVQNVTLPPITISAMPPIPPGVNEAVLQAENRNFTVFLPELTVEAWYLSQADWTLHVDFYAHEEGNTTWVSFQNYSIPNSLGAIWSYELITADHWIARIATPDLLQTAIVLKYVLWKAAADAYPLWIAVSIYVTGIIALSCSNTGCTTIDSLPWQDAVRVVAP